MPPAGLRSRVERAVGLRRRAMRPTWSALAASVALAVMLSSAATWSVLAPGRAGLVEDEVVGSHIRALMARAALRRRVVRPPHRQAVVQRTHRAVAARGRPRGGRLSAGRRAHRRDRQNAGAVAGLSLSEASHQRDRHPGSRRAAARARRRRLPRDRMDRWRRVLLGGVGCRASASWRNSCSCFAPRRRTGEGTGRVIA